MQKVSVKIIEQGNKYYMEYSIIKMKISTKAQTNYLSKEHDREEDREEGLHGLDGVGEGDSHLAQTHIGKNISQHVDQSKRQDLCILHQQTKTITTCPHQSYE